LPSRVDDSKHWRERAAHMRALSEMTKDTNVVATMLQLALDYDLLADRADARSSGSALPDDKSRSHGGRG
jgi:hypothetical protein